jgi:predicted enzyme related to lactoylglutathione lyase
MTAAPGAAAGLCLVLDCADPDRLAGFWAAALGYQHVGTCGKYAMLMARDGSGRRFALQAVPEPKRHKNRMHVDLVVDDIEHAAGQLESLGARRDVAGPCEEHGHRWIIMADPEGNEFCVCAR